MEENIIEVQSGNPVAQFFELIFEMWQALPDVIQALIAMVVATSVFFGIMQMIRS